MTTWSCKYSKTKINHLVAKYFWDQGIFKKWHLLLGIVVLQLHTVTPLSNTISHSSYHDYSRMDPSRSKVTCMPTSNSYPSCVGERRVLCQFPKRSRCKYSSGRQLSACGSVYRGSTVAKGYPTVSTTVCSRRGPVHIYNAGSKGLKHVKGGEIKKDVY